MLSSGLSILYITEAAYKYGPNISCNVSFWQVFCYKIVVGYLTLKKQVYAVSNRDSFIKTFDVLTFFRNVMEPKRRTSISYKIVCK